MSLESRCGADDLQGREPLARDPHNLVEWLAGWIDWSRDTRRSYRSSFGVVYNWGVAAGHVGISPAATLSPIAPKRALPRPVPTDRLQAAVEGAEPRVRLALLLLAETGMRRAELAAMDTDDLLQDANGWSLQGLHGGMPRRHREQVWRHQGFVFPARRGPAKPAVPAAHLRYRPRITPRPPMLLRGVYVRGKQ